QALYAAGEFAKSAEVFRVVSFDEKQTAKREEAAFSRVLCAEKLAEGQNPPLPPRLIDAQVAAYEDYITLNPTSDKNASLLFKEGNLYFTSAKFPSAIAAFERLIATHRADPLAAEANDLIAQAHFRLGNFAAAEQWSEKALAAAAPDNPLGKRRDEVEKLYAMTMFKQGEKADEEKQYGEASRDYLRLADKLPANEVAARALYNAASATERAKQKPEAARLFQRLIDTYTASDLAPDAAVRLAEFYKDQPGGTDQIIQIYERVADTHVDDPKGEEFLFLAGKLAAKDHKAPETIRLFEKFLSRYRSQTADLRGERNVEALYHLGSTYAAAGNVGGARQNLELFLSQARPAKASFGDDAQGYDYATANARLLLGNMQFEEYRSVRIHTPVAETLKRKETLLNAIVDRYAPAVASGIAPLATEASFRIGNSYEDFAAAIEDAPRPAGLTAEEQAEYDRLLQERVRPFLAKAVDAYRVTVRAAREKPLDDPWVGRCRERLAAVAPRAFARSPRPGYMRLAAAADPPPAVLSTFAGVKVDADSGPGFFGSLFADEEKTRLRNFAKGLGAAQSGDWNEAANQFLEAAKDGPPEAGYNAAVALAQQKKTSQALRSLEEVTRKSPDFLPAITLAARLYEQNGNRDAAASAYRKAAESPRVTAAERLARARFLERQKQTSEALSVYQEVLAAEPMNGEALLATARLDGSEGTEELVKLIGPLGRSATSLVELGVLAGEREAPRVAAQAFAAARSALASSDRLSLVTVLTNEALAAAGAGELERANSLLGAARKVDVPLPIPAIANASGIVLMRQGDFQSAESEFKKAVTAAPTFGPSWANLGILNELYFGSPEQAVECYNRYVATHPPDEAVVTGWIREIRDGGTNARRKSI
ncbi:MAG: tetratricopeptide repeat protein, partial [Candidatus Binatia bacterium]